MDVATLTPVADYLRLDEASELKHEYHAGQVYAMAGASLVHNTITSNLVREMGNRRLRGCRVVQSDLRVHVENEEHDYAYPDVVVLCGTPRLSGERPDTLLNPGLLVEVTSRSTGTADFGWKLRAYTQIESLQEYWIVEQDEPAVTRYFRHGDLWAIRFHRGLDDAVESELLAASLPLSGVYAEVFPAPEPAPPETRS